MPIKTYLMIFSKSGCPYVGITQIRLNGSKFVTSSQPGHQLPKTILIFLDFNTADIGSQYVPPSPDDVPVLMKHLADQIQSSRSALHPIELAAMAHKRLVDIHPFISGNVRTARLLMNLILVNTGYGVVNGITAVCSDYNKE